MKRIHGGIVKINLIHNVEMNDCPTATAMAPTIATAVALFSAPAVAAPTVAALRGTVDDDDIDD